VAISLLSSQDAVQLANSVSMVIMMMVVVDLLVVT
jgi:hypothetical protein